MKYYEISRKTSIKRIQITIKTQAICGPLSFQSLKLVINWSKTDSVSYLNSHKFDFSAINIIVHGFLIE